jgi:hypothetical protein
LGEEALTNAKHVPKQEARTRLVQNIALQKIINYINVREKIYGFPTETHMFKMVQSLKEVGY